MESLQRQLGMTVLPEHIECFDNSNIQGANPVSACVVFRDGVPSKKDYRHFKVKTVVGANDYATMKEAVNRRYSRMLAEDPDDLPQLIVIDGGFCRAYQPTSGIAGYTLIYNSRCIRIVSHQPFESKEAAILRNHDIANDSLVFEHMEHRVKISETDVGRDIQAQAEDLRRLLQAYRSGAFSEGAE